MMAEAQREVLVGLAPEIEPLGVGNCDSSCLAEPSISATSS
jgi:hypothetical protein